jgi:AraC family transcriptional regulator
VIAHRNDRQARPAGLGPRRKAPVATKASWAGIVEVKQHRAPAADVAEVAIERHTVQLHLGPAHAVTWGIAGGELQRTIVPPGSLTLLAAGTRLGWRRAQAIDLLVVTLDPQFVSALADAPARAGEVALRTAVAFEDPAIAYILRAMQAAQVRRSATTRLYEEALATALIRHLLDHYAAPPQQPARPAGGLPEGRLRRVLDHIAAHLGEEMSLRHLADLVHLSPDHFATLFRQSVGLPPHRYVLEQRIARARQLLAAGDLPLAEIGYALGYTSQAHFITMFRKQTGLTPGAYRKRHGPGSAGTTTTADSGFREQSSRESERRRRAVG